MPTGFGGMLAATRDRTQGIPGEYQPYQVGGQEFSTINPTVAPWLEKAATWALVKGAQAVPQAWLGGPGRMYKQAVIDRRTQSFTEKDFSEKELQSLARVVATAQRSHQKVIDYKTHGQAPSPWREMIGKAAYTTMPDSSVTVDDTYDFNNYERGVKYNNAESGEMAIGGPGATGMSWLGRRALPSGVRGVPVKIRIPAGMVHKASQSYTP